MGEEDGKLCIKEEHSLTKEHGTPSYPEIVFDFF